MAEGEGRVQPDRQVWDLPVRVFHWLLVLAVAGAWITHQLGVVYFKYHVWCGYTVLVLVSFRILWGLVGTRHARFWNFVRNPFATIRYSFAFLGGREPHYAGHNPLGGWMVLLLLSSLLAQAVFGLFGNDEIFNLGPLYGYVTNDTSLELTSLHRKLFYWILGAIVLHIGAVIFHRIARGENLVRPMFTGRKPAAVVPESEAIGSSRLIAAIAIVVLLAATLAWIVQHAPVPQDFSSFN
jgi:cytochrome b